MTAFEKSEVEARFMTSVWRQRISEAVSDVELVPHRARDYVYGRGQTLLELESLFSLAVLITHIAAAEQSEIEMARVENGEGSTSSLRRLAIGVTCCYQQCGRDGEDL